MLAADCLLLLHARHVLRREDVGKKGLTARQAKAAESLGIEV
jgi:hypothetical protein